MKIAFALIFSVLLSFKGMAGALEIQNTEPQAHKLMIDTSNLQSMEQIMGLDPSLKLKKCEIVISSHGAVFKIDYDKDAGGTVKKLTDRLKKLHQGDILFIDNIWVIKDDKLMKLTGQKAFTIQ